MDATALIILVPLVIMLGILTLPRVGLLSRLRKGKDRSRREKIEDALKHIYDCEYKGRECTVNSIAGVAQLTQNKAGDLIERLEEGGLATVQGEVVLLTETGREYALRIVRSHRLWERFLADETEVHETRWHRQAERMEHELSDEEVDQLAAQLGHPQFDPHGDPIPTGLGNQPATDAIPLTKLPVRRFARIVHVEDEPESTYAELVRRGLRPGLTVRVANRTGSETALEVNGLTITVSPMMAANLTVSPIREHEPAEEEEPHGKTLDELEIGESARVKRILPQCRGAQRRRLMDLGVIPGTEILADMPSPFGDPVAYRIRSAMIALRSDQARMIEIEDEQVHA